MKRRDFLGKGALGGAAVIGGAAATVGLVGCGGSSEPSTAGPAVHTKKRIQWRLASSFPRSLDTLYGAAERLSGLVERMSGGGFKIRSYSGGEIVPSLEVLDAVQQGTVQVGQTASYYYVGKNPALAFDCCVPFGLTSRQQCAWLEQGGGRQLMDELFSDYNIVTFSGGNTGAQMGGWWRKELTSLADLAGLKVRVPGLGGEVMDRLGASVQVLAGGEIYSALERGAIDATEWVGPYDDEKLGFYRVAKIYHYPGWWEPGPNMTYYVGKKAWGELPADYQEIFRTACRETAYIMQAQYDHGNPAALERLLAEGVQLKPFPEDLMAAARREAAAMLEEQAAADPGYARIYKAWKKARAASFHWFGTAELAYAHAAFARMK